MASISSSRFRRIRLVLAVGLSAGGLGLFGFALQTSHALPRAATRANVPTEERSLSVDQSLTLTVVLNRTDQAGFDRFLAATNDAHSSTYRHYLAPAEQARRFGPTTAAYDEVRAWLDLQGFVVEQASDNRLTLTIHGSRALAEKAFGVHITSRQLADRIVYENTNDPVLPLAIADHVQAVIGLSNLADPVRARPTITTGPINRYGADLPLSCWVAQRALGSQDGEGLIVGGLAGYQCMGDALNLLNLLASGGFPSRKHDSLGISLAAFSGAGQKVGLVEFDNFNPTDVQNYLDLVGHSSQFGQLSQVHVSGGAGAPGADESEVLLDIAAVMSLAPGAQVIVYDAPFKGRGSFQSVFNAMINDGVNVISNSWAYCEDQTTRADIQSIESILSSAAAAGITVLTGSGDTGSTCLNGSKNIAAVPASCPHVTAVGGTTITRNIGGTYGGEKWWDNSSSTPAGGQGGFGISKFFSRPSYQDGLTTATMRSVPDVTAPADPLSGYFICQQDAGGCPTGLLYGGTSVATPFWAAIVAVLNQVEGRQLGFLNPILYPLANTKAFHSASEMSSDFAHVGLGSPNADQLHLKLTNTTAGPVSTTSSYFDAYPSKAIADGQNKAGIVVMLVDANGNSITGQQVQLSVNSGAHAVITPVNLVTNDSNGAALFTATDTSLETVTFTATVNGTTLPQQPKVSFVSAPAASGGIAASPTTVNANDSDATTITVTLQDAKGNPSPGKLINLSQGNGASVISGNATTDATGQVKFTAVDSKAESITYTAVDVTDSDLPIPGSATVNFVNPSGFCAQYNSARFGMVASGYAVTTFASNFQDDCFTGIGPIGLTFDASGTLLVGDYQTNSIYAFERSGETAGPATIAGSVPPPHNAGLDAINFTSDGRLYGVAKYDNNLLEIDPKTANVIRAIPIGEGGLDLHQDPFSGDLFVTGNSGHVLRIQNLATASPTVTTYLNGGFDGFVFNVDGTIYAAASSGVYRIPGTNAPQPVAYSLLVSLNQPDGIGIEPNPNNTSKPFLIVNRNDGTITRVDTSTLPADPNTPCGSACVDIYTGGSRGDFVTVGPDGCFYATQSDRVIKVTKADGTCSLATTETRPQLVLTPGVVATSPPQGTSVTFTATLKNASNLANIGVTLVISGVNAGVQLGRTDANGVATISLPGVFTGRDDVSAVATISNGVQLTSNHTIVTWVAGKHTTLLSLNSSPATGAPNKPISLLADLVDVSVSPVVPIAGVSVSFDLTGQACSATTDGSGHASCEVTSTATDGPYQLKASFAGNDSFLPSNQQKALELITPPPQQLLNISTRMEVLTGNNVLIGGFIITGTEAKKVIIRGMGPSLPNVTGALQDPTLELHKPDGTITTNDNWKDSQRAEIEATGIPPGDDRESAIVATLQPGAYTAVLGGKGGTTGVGLVEVYDISGSVITKLANISTRGFVDTGDNVMIGGFIAGPQDGGLAKVIIRALGPSLGVPGSLEDPTLELHGANGDILATNDNWKDSQQAEIQATGIPPSDERESALVEALAPGSYTAIVRGKSNSTGVALVEAYNLE